MAKKYIWILMGRTGEYSETIEWIVATFQSGKDAEFVKLLTQDEAQKIMQESHDYSIYGGNKYDKDMKIYDHKILYFIFRVPYYPKKEKKNV